LPKSLEWAAAAAYRFYAKMEYLIAWIGVLAGSPDLTPQRLGCHGISPVSH
jgi:hypothetical protein